MTQPFVSREAFLDCAPEIASRATFSHGKISIAGTRDTIVTLN